MVSPVLQRTVRRALAEEGIFRFKAKRAPWIRPQTQTERVNYADVCLTLPLFTWIYTVWTDEGHFTLYRGYGYLDHSTSKRRASAERAPGGY